VFDGSGGTFSDDCIVEIPVGDTEDIFSTGAIAGTQTHYWAWSPATPECESWYAGPMSISEAVRVWTDGTNINVEIVDATGSGMTQAVFFSASVPIVRGQKVYTISNELVSCGGYWGGDYGKSNVSAGTGGQVVLTFDIDCECLYGA